MPRDIELVKQELESSTTSIFITKWILEHTPYVFEDYETEYISWRHEIAEKLRIDARDIIITGSASLGFSLNPNKNFKSFDKKSDIDISIISHHYFDVAWHDLIHLSPAGIFSFTKYSRIFFAIPDLVKIPVGTTIAAFPLGASEYKMCWINSR